MNIKDIAALAETSVATVSRVINCDGRVSDATRQRVLEVIATTGYKPELVGRALRAGNRGTILVSLPSIANPFFSRVVEGVEHRAAANNYNTLLCITHRDDVTEKRYLDLFKTNQIDGAILFTSSLPSDELDQMAAKFPIVKYGPENRNLSHISLIGIDDFSASRDAVNYLARIGHQAIAIVVGPHERPFETARFDGYLAALRDAGIAFMKQYVVHSEYNHREAYEACKKLLASREPPTAIFCCSDLMAIGAVKAIVEANLLPGRDIDVIGFDGTYLADITTPAITCIEQPQYEMGKASFDLLLERITDASGLAKKVILPHKIVKRSSTRQSEAGE